MPLFDVPGWSVTADPVVDQASRKRKRHSEDSERVSGAEVNFDKLVKKLKGKTGGEHKHGKAPWPPWK